MTVPWRKKEIELLLCGRYSEIARFFERSGIVPIYVTDSIIAVWTRSVSATKIVSVRHVSAKREHSQNF